MIAEDTRNIEIAYKDAQVKVICNGFGRKARLFGEKYKSLVCACDRNL